VEIGDLSRTRYKPITAISLRGAGGVNEGYLEAHYAQRASAMAPLPEDDGRKPGDQQAWTSEQRHALTRHVDERARDAVEAYTTLPEDTDPSTNNGALRGAQVRS